MPIATQTREDTASRARKREFLRRYRRDAVVEEFRANRASPGGVERQAERGDERR